MKYFVVFAALVGACAAQQGARFSATQSGNDIVIVRSENENDGNGNFKWLSELSDGTKLEQSGYTKPSNDPEFPTLQVIQGAYQYTSPEGEQINLQYTADENGFQPQGAHLPTPPPVPEAIQKALDLIYANAGNSAAASQVSQQYSPRPQAPASRLSQPRRF